MTKPKLQKNEIEVLLSEEKIGPYTLKPWSFGRFQQVFPVLTGRLIPALVDAGIDLERLDQITKEGPDKGLAFLPEIATALMPALPPLVAATLDLEESEVHAMDFDQVLLIGLTIVTQNLARIKNSLPLAVAKIRAIAGGT
jgi:hypothetical protein